MEEIEYDKCVLCEEVTKEPKDKHIDFLDSHRYLHTLEICVVCVA